MASKQPSTPRRTVIQFVTALEICSCLRPVQRFEMSVLRSDCTQLDSSIAPFYTRVQPSFCTAVRGVAANKVIGSVNNVHVGMASLSTVCPECGGTLLPVAQAGGRLVCVVCGSQSQVLPEHASHQALRISTARIICLPLRPA